jgi:hypothetical protein
MARTTKTSAKKTPATKRVAPMAKKVHKPFHDKTRYAKADRGWYNK